MLVTQRIDQRRHETCVGNARQAVNAGLPDAPVIGGEQRPHDRIRIGLLEPGQRLGGTLTDIWVGAGQRFGDIALGLHPFGDVLDGGHGADDAIVLTQRADRDALLHLR